MNVEIGAEAALFPEKEYISGSFVAVYSIPWFCRGPCPKGHIIAYNYTTLQPECRCEEHHSFNSQVATVSEFYVEYNAYTLHNAHAADNGTLKLKIQTKYKAHKMVPRLVDNKSNVWPN